MSILSLTKWRKKHIIVDIVWLYRVLLEKAEECIDEKAGRICEKYT